MWDLAYYAWLKLLMGWPHSLLDWDLIFAAPLPWVGPVLAPLVVAAVMVLASGFFFWRESVGRPIQPRPLHWVVVLVGGLVVMVSFWLDTRNILASGNPGPFNWPVLIAGLIGGLAGFGHAAFLTRR
jgi:hypothetical protein